VSAVQPKAVGSSLLLEISRLLALDAIQIAGFATAKHTAMLPVATGMSLTLVMRAIHEERPLADEVVFLRVDQKSCIKSIRTAGLQPIVVSGTIQGDEVVTDLKFLEAHLQARSEKTVCVLSNTSCFAPRSPDSLVKVALLCSKYKVPHVVNNAYGVQSRKCCHLLDAASRMGRVDITVQSVDKNFMVPVSGCLLAARDRKLVMLTCQAYPGRASGTAMLDVAITLLSMGRSIWRKLLDRREESYERLKVGVLVPVTCVLLA